MNLSSSDLEVLNHPDGIVFPDGSIHEFTPEEKVAETIKIKKAVAEIRDELEKVARKTTANSRNPKQRKLAKD